MCRGILGDGVKLIYSGTKLVSETFSQVKKITTRMRNSWICSFGHSSLNLPIVLGRCRCRCRCRCRSYRPCLGSLIVRDFKGVFTWYRRDFHSGMSSLQFPLVALYSFTWYQHKISYRSGSYRCEFTPVRGCLHDTGATFIPVRVHSSSLLWLFIRLHGISTKSHTRASHTGVSSTR